MNRKADSQRVVRHEGRDSRQGPAELMGACFEGDEALVTSQPWRERLARVWRVRTDHQRRQVERLAELLDKERTNG